jgi:hypothetical protein
MGAEADESAEAGAPELEIEITPEMIEAGSSVIIEEELRTDFSVFTLPAEELAERVYRAMHSRRA